MFRQQKIAKYNITWLTFRAVKNKLKIQNYSTYVGDMYTRMTTKKIPNQKHVSFKQPTVLSNVLVSMETCKLYGDH